MPLRDKGSHSIHTLPGIETIFNIFKLFMSEKSKSRVCLFNLIFKISLLRNTL